MSRPHESDTDHGAAESTRARRALRVIGWVTALLAALLILVTPTLVWTAPGRRFVADRIETILSDQIPGFARIGVIERLVSPTVVRDLEFFHPGTRRVLHIERAVVDIDFSAAFGGKLVFEHAEARGGTLSLWIDPDGRSSLEGAFMSKTPDPESDFRYALRDIAVEHLLVELDVTDGDPYRVREARGLVDIERMTTDGVRVDLNAISGHVSPRFAGMPVRLMRVDGWVHGKMPQVLKLWARTRVGDGKLNAQFNLFDRDKTPVEVSLQPIEGSSADLAALVAYAGSQLSSDVKVELGGP